MRKQQLGTQKISAYGTQKTPRARSASGNLRTISTLPFLHKEKFNMKSWLRKKLRNLLSEDIEMPMPQSNLRHLEDFSLGVITARGGSIISVRKYDRNTGEDDTILHIIPDDSDFKVELANIITMETLRG